SAWNADGDSALVRQTVDLELAGGDLVLTAGVSHEYKDLARNYDISGYWNDAFSSVDDVSDVGPEGLGPGVVHSTSVDPYDAPELPPTRVPDADRFQTHELG